MYEQIRASVILQFMLALAPTCFQGDDSVNESAIKRRAIVLADSYMLHLQQFNLLPPLPPLEYPEIKLVVAGKIIQAIKAYKDRTGTSLKESKQMVDQCKIELRAATETPGIPQSNNV